MSPLRLLKIHLITNLFRPDELAGASLYTDMALFFKEQGHDIRVTTTFSYYPAWKLTDEDQGVSLRDEEFQGIPVRRVSMHIPEKASGAGRMLSDASFFLSLWRRGCFQDWFPDVVITASPMFSQCLVQRFIYRGKKIPRLIVVQDFVVDAALELGIVKLPGFGPFFRMLERWAFSSAQTLLTISPGMLTKLESKVKNRRLRCVPNWIHQSLQDEIDRQDRPPRLNTSLLYAGNLGKKQGLPDFLNDFAAVGSDWKMRIHGGGAEAGALREAAMKLANVHVGGVLDERAYITELLTTTACLITQRAGVGDNFLPSKLLPALATGTPVLAVCEATSPLGREVVEGAFGIVVPPRDQNALRAGLALWADKPQLLAALSKAARERSSLYKRDRILNIYLDELQYLAVQ